MRQCPQSATLYANVVSDLTHSILNLKHLHGFPRKSLRIPIHSERNIEAIDVYFSCIEIRPTFPKQSLRRLANSKSKIRLLGDMKTLQFSILIKRI